MIAIYPRVSTQEQAMNGYSIDEQIDRMTKYSDAMGWKIYKVYTDAGYSGANTDRPALQEMIKDIKAGKVDRVLVYKLDRLSRSQKDTLYLIEDVFLANNCDFVSMSENFDTSTPFGRAMIGILAVFAQLEREQIKERLKMGKDARAKLGKFHGGKSVPIGYEYIDGELVTNEYEKMQIVEAFTMYSNGASIHKIIKTFDDAGYTHKYGKWIDKTMRAVLKQRTYLGEINYKGEWHKGSHEAFISEELYNKVNSMIEAKNKQYVKHNRRLGLASSYLTGYLECGCCGSKYAKKTMKHKSKVHPDIIYEYPQYICYSRMKSKPTLIKDPNCKNKNWPMHELDNIVFGEIRKLSLDPEYYHEVKDHEETDNRIDVIKAEINNIDSQISRLMDLYTVGQVPLDLLQDKMHGLTDKKNKLSNEIDKILDDKKEILSHEKTLEIVNSFDDILNRQDLDEIRTAIGILIDKIVIDGNDITIHWNF